ncbi:uncharacterized protein (DUF58 family) [Glaciihabitans tibetensis]|uniref:Uncharacterized protein (DUF58 family) n=1 Tax=Glaciihabitans tibetensis TaxID=1266600 RepID=A0A2T0VHE2_9MICO|nr:DUF58 domain-containing protein [Glaciihabitans tibetensis]PRY69620.1 uncharacterized protein (DUF58 family) [Glaciihabitans tibetensis]
MNTRTRTRALTRSLGDSAFATEGLTNARTRIVGARTGLLADAIVGSVRIFRIARAAMGTAGQHLAAVVTPVGWALLLLVPVGFLTGYGFGWIELVVAAWAGLVLLCLAALYLISSAPLDVDLSLVSVRVAVGDDASGHVVVRNPRRVQLRGANLEVPMGHGLIEIALPPLAHNGQYRREFAVPTVRRGVVPIGPARSIRADPVGLVRREQSWTQTASLFVHPRTVAIPSMSSGLVRDLEGNPTRDLSTSDMSFHALREYQPGDERRSIHWKSTAKTGVHMVRQFEETRRSHLLVALSLANGDYATDDEFEMAVSVAASLGARAIRDTRDVTVAVSAATPEFATRKVFAVTPLPTLSRARLLDALAAVDRAAAALAIVDVARVASDQVVGVSVAFLVCGSPVNSSQLRAASAKFPPGVETVAIVCDPESVPGVRALAGLTVFTIGYLEDLKAFLARSAAA